MTRRIVFLNIVWTLGIAVAAGAQATDQQLATDIARALARYTQLTIFDDVGASVEDGVVTLRGKVTMPFKKNEIAKRVSAIEGIREVGNRIDVLPVSLFDEELRYKIARAIYGNPSFWHYASMVNPPIHIIVEHGHVTLTGVVQSHVDRMLARSLATSFGALSVTNNLKTDAELRAAIH